MSNIKLISELNIREVENICDNVDGCAECPLLISSYKKLIHCLKDDEIRLCEIEKELRNMMKHEISSKTIGEVVMKYLKTFDKVAYIRFASVYRKFSDIDNFKQELENLNATNKDKS